MQSNPYFFWYKQRHFIGHILSRALVRGGFRTRCTEIYVTLLGALNTQPPSRFKCLCEKNWWIYIHYTCLIDNTISNIPLTTEWCGGTSSKRVGNRFALALSFMYILFTITARAQEVLTLLNASDGNGKLALWEHRRLARKKRKKPRTSAM